MVPKFAQDEIWQHYRQGQETDKNPSKEYVKATLRAKVCVMAYEGGARKPDEMLQLFEKMIATPLTSLAGSLTE